MRGINSVKLQCGVWNCEAANIMEKRAGLNQFIAYAGRKQRLTHTHTHTLKSLCMTTALVQLKVSNSRRHMNCSSIFSLARIILFFSEKYSRCVHLILIYSGTKAASFLSY